MIAFDVVLLTATGDEAAFRMYAKSEYALLIALAALGLGPERVVSVVAVIP